MSSAAPRLQRNVGKGKPKKQPEGYVQSQDNNNVQTFCPAQNDITISMEHRAQILREMEATREKLPMAVITRSMISVFSFAEMRRVAVCDVNRAAYEGLGSVNDKQMGVVGNSVVCQRCSKIDCPGHYGLITFKKMIYNPMFIRNIIKVLTCVCNECSGLLMPYETMEKKGILKLADERRLTALELASKDLDCSRQHCGKGYEGTIPCVPNPSFISANLKDTNKVMKKSKSPGSEGKEEVMPIEQVWGILDQISPEDAELMGFRNGMHPRNFIMKGILVNPPVARPPTKEGGVVKQDLMTDIFVQIVKANNEIENADDVNIATNKLFNQVKKLIDNSDNKYGHLGSYISILQKIQGKAGAFRSILMGKRGDFCARTILSPDPSLKFGQISVPLVYARVLTKKVRVIESNKLVLMKLLVAGRITHITKGEGPKKGTRQKWKAGYNYDLQPGDIVDRWLQDGDMVVFNRQPTLHKQSMMAYEVVLSDRLTIGLHLSYCGAHNADEMRS